MRDNLSLLRFPNEIDAAALVLAVLLVGFIIEVFE
jgi:hypothetical protein